MSHFFQLIDFQDYIMKSTGSYRFIIVGVLNNLPL